MDKIKTLEDIRQRCWIDDDGHWIWKGATNGMGTPVCRFDQKQSVTVRRLAYCLKNRIPYNELPHERVWAAVGGRLNVNPDHASVGSIADFNAWKNPKQKGMKARLAAIKGKNTVGRRYTPEQIEYIRTCGRTEKDLAAEFGCSKTLIGYIRRGRCYVSLTRGASVFSMGLAA